MFTLVQLPYAMEALEPVISAQTLSFHHGKHLQAYVDNLNKLLPGSGFEGMTLCGGGGKRRGSLWWRLPLRLTIFFHSTPFILVIR